MTLSTEYTEAVIEIIKFDYEDIVTISGDPRNDETEILRG